MKPIILALTCAMAAFFGTAANAIAANPYILTPAWKSAPSRADVTAALLSKAKDLRQPTDARIVCQLKSDGALTACGEFYGFQRGQETKDVVLALIPKFIAYAPKDFDPAKGPVNVSLSFHFTPPDQSAEPVLLVAPELRTIRGAVQPPLTFPDAAAKAGYKGGLGIVECEGTATGAVAGCTIVKETPANVGIAASALAFAQTMNLNPWQQAEPMEGSKVRIPVYVNSADAAHDPSLTRQAIFHVPVGYQGTAGPYFPDRALRMGVNGSAMLECVLSADGDLDDCVPVAESTPNMAFAIASLIMATRRAIKATPRSVDGRPVDGEVVFVVVPFTANSGR